MSSRRLVLPGILLVVAFSSTIGHGFQAPPPAAPQTRGQGLLIGQVVDSGGAGPIGGALVVLGGSPSLIASPVVFSFSQAQIPGGERQTLTDPEGHFVFSEVPAGTYSLQATKPGYSPGGYGRRHVTGRAQSIVINDSDRMGDLSIPLFKYASIAGTVTDEAGEPLIGAQVIALRRIYENGRTRLTSALSGMNAETDDRGAFRLGTLIPGEYAIQIRSTQATVPMATVNAYRAALNSGNTDVTRELSAAATSVSLSTPGLPVGDQFFQPSSFGPTAAMPPPPGSDGKLYVYPTWFYPSTTVIARATMIPVRAGEERQGVNLQLKPVTTSRISGVVTGASGPVANMSLDLVPAAPSPAEDTFFPTAVTISDADGAFTFLGVPQGQYLIHALRVPPRPAPVGAPPTVVQSGSTTIFTNPNAGAPPPVSLPTASTLWASVPVSVDRVDVKGVTVPVQSGFRIGGRFDFDGTAKPAADWSRRVAVIFEPLDDRSAANYRVTRGSIDAAGLLSSFELPPGKYYVRVEGALPGWTFKGAMHAGRDLSDVPFDLDANISDVVLSFTDHPTMLDGAVRRQGGAADAAAAVLAFPVEAASTDFAGAPRRLRSVRANRSGGYELAGLPAGDYFVVAVADEAAADFPSLTLVRALARLATRVKIADGEHRTMDLTTVTVR